MQSDDYILLLIIFAIFALLYFSPKIKKNKEAKALAMARARELEIQAVAARKIADEAYALKVAQEQEAARVAQIASAKIYQEKNTALSAKKSSEMGKPTPHYIQQALSKFEKDYKSNSDSFKSMNEFSPLACFGYKVGKTSGLREQQRREIIQFTWYANIPSIVPREYAKEWGAPGTHKRFIKILNHLSMLATQRASRKGFEVAVEHWESDGNWFKKSNQALADQYNQYGFNY